MFLVCKLQGHFGCWLTYCCWGWKGCNTRLIRGKWRAIIPRHLSNIVPWPWCSTWMLILVKSRLQKLENVLCCLTASRWVAHVLVSLCSRMKIHEGLNTSAVWISNTPSCMRKENYIFFYIILLEVNITLFPNDFFLFSLSIRTQVCKVQLKFRVLGTFLQSTPMLFCLQYAAKNH